MNEHDTGLHYASESAYRVAMMRRKLDAMSPAERREHDARADAELTPSQKQLITMLSDGIRMATAPLWERLRAAEGKLKELEAKSLHPVYAGVHDAHREYQRGDLTTRGGGLWLALDRTRTTPGENPTMWRLIVKSGGA
jgi:hypothetical protein